MASKKTLTIVDDLSVDKYMADNAVATIIFAHGAGADKDSDFISEVCEQLCQADINVYRFNFPYMQQRLIDGKRRPPNKMDVLQQSLLARIDDYDIQLPLFIGGKSMGSRVAATLANHEKVSGVFCIGYPFHPAKKPEKLRLEPLQQATKPVLIVQGTRDALGSIEDIAEYDLPSNINIVYVEDGDHDLKPRVKSGHTHSGHKMTAVTQICRLIDEN